MNMSILTAQKLKQFVDARKRIAETFPVEDSAAPVNVPRAPEDIGKEDVQAQDVTSSDVSDDAVVPEKNLLSPELKIKHKKSGLLYTIHAIDDQMVVLRSPDNRKFSIDRDEIEKEYVLD